MIGPTNDTTQAPTSELMIRVAQPGDADSLRRLAERDTAAVPSGVLLIAEQHGEVRAALPISGGPAIADPFHRTATIVRMLRVAARAA